MTPLAMAYNPYRVAYTSPMGGLGVTKDGCSAASHLSFFYLFKDLIFLIKLMNL